MAPTLPPPRGAARRRAPTSFFSSRYAYLLAPLALLIGLPLFLHPTGRDQAPSIVAQRSVDDDEPREELPIEELKADNAAEMATMLERSQQQAAPAADEPADAAAEPGRAALPADVARCDDFEVHTDTDLLHGDMGSQPAQGGSSLGSCCAMCAAKAGCVGLTFTPERECWLKSSVGEPTKQRGLISAMHKSLGGGGGGGGGGGILQSVERRAAARAQEGARVRARAHEQQQQPARVGLPPGPAVSLGGGCSSDPAVGCMRSPAVVVMSHDRPEMTRRCLQALLSLPLIDKFTVYVSEDANSGPVRRAAAEFGSKVKEVLSSTPRVGTTTFKRGGVYKIAQHFKAAAEATLVARQHSHAIFIEDDLLLSPDFLTLFWESAWLLEADPSLWCVSAWNDQGFPHTAQDPHRLLRTDYFPGLGWMVPRKVWDELRGKWPEAPTTGWDHWMRLSSNSKGRECVAPEINRSRHASKRGTNVVDNKPFERFSFETRGVQSFGDLTYLLRDAHEGAVATRVAGARRARWPEAWGGATTFEAAVKWVERLPAEPGTLLLYRREEYKQLAKPLGLWGENQRATHNGTITLRTPSGGTLLLADVRKCPYLEPSERLRPPANLRQLAADLGVSCDAACAQAGGRCEPTLLEWGNSCEAMAAHFGCEAGCGHQVGTELPAYAATSDLDTHRQCLISDIAVSECKAAFKKTRRLCSCV